MVGESRGESLAHSQRINPYPNQSWLTLRNGSLCRGSLWQGRPGGCSLAAASMGPCVLSMRVGTVKSFGVIPCSWKNSGRVLTFDWLFLGCNRHGWSRDPGGGVPVVFKDRCCFCQRSLCSLLYPGDRTREVSKSQEGKGSLLFPATGKCLENINKRTEKSSGWYLERRVLTEI